MNFLILSPFDDDLPRGNSVAASRLARGLKSRGHGAIIVGPKETASVGNDFRFDGGYTPDLLLVLHGYHCAEATYRLGRHFRIPVFVSIRGTDANEMFDDPQKSPVLLSALRQADKIVVFTEDILVNLSARTGLPRGNFAIVPNGLEIPCSNIDYRKRLQVRSDSFVFASLAGIREVKRPLLPARSLAAVRSLHREIVFLHAGPVIEEKCAVEFFRFAANADWMVHAGVIAHSETDSFLRAADVFVSASSSEGMPHAAREAMAQGLACLLSDIPGHRRIANDKTAVFFHNEDDFKKNALTLVEDNELRKRLGQQAARFVKSALVESDEVGALIALAEQISNSGHTGRS